MREERSRKWEAESLKWKAKNRRGLKIGSLPSQRIFFFISFTTYSHALAVIAMYVREGFTQEEEAMKDPSVTNTFFTSCI